MARKPNDEIDRLKTTLSLIEMCRSRGIDLKPCGKRDLIGRCPFHDDREPSFIVSPHENRFHCPTCGASGSLTALAMKLEGRDGRAAPVPWLCRASELGAETRLKNLSFAAESESETSTVRAGGGDGGAPPDFILGTSKTLAPTGSKRPGGALAVMRGASRFSPVTVI